MMVVGSRRIATDVRVIGASGGETMGALEAVRDRFLVGAADAGGGFSLVEHLLPPRALAAPLHRHSREDEYSYVLDGTVGAVIGDVGVTGTAGDLILKPRGEWHTFWNAGDVPARILEIISPGGFDEAFREMHSLGDDLVPQTMAAIAARYGVDVDFEATFPLIEEHRLVF